MNCTSSGLIAIGTITGAATMNPIVLGVISGVGLIMKTAMEMKNLKNKIEMSKFAFTTYEKTLSDLRFALRGGNFDQTQFLSSMEAIDGIVIDLGLDLEKFENEWKEKFSMEWFHRRWDLKKDFFPTNLWRGDLTNSLPKQLRSNSGDEKTKSWNFWGFPKSGDEILENNFFQKFFFFFENIFWEKIFSRFWKIPRFRFCFLLGLSWNLFLLEKIPKWTFLSWRELF